MKYLTLIFFNRTEIQASPAPKCSQQTNKQKTRKDVTKSESCPKLIFFLFNKAHIITEVLIYVSKAFDVVLYFCAQIQQNSPT